MCRDPISPKKWVWYQKALFGTVARPILLNQGLIFQTAHKKKDKVEWVCRVFYKNQRWTQLLELDGFPWTDKFERKEPSSNASLIC